MTPPTNPDPQGPPALPTYFTEMTNAGLVAWLEAQGVDASELKGCKRPELLARVQAKLAGGAHVLDLDLPGGDPILAVRQEVEALEDEQEAVELLHRVQNRAGLDSFRMGGVLSTMKARGWGAYGQQGEFWGYVEAEFGIKERRGRYLVSAYDTVVACGITWSAAKAVDWSKVADLASAGVLSPDSWQQWFELADTVTRQQLADLVKQHKAEGTGPCAAAVPTLESLTLAPAAKGVEGHGTAAACHLAVPPAEAPEVADSIPAADPTHTYVDLDGLPPLKAVFQAMKDKDADSWQDVLEALAEVWYEVSLSARPKEESEAA